MIMNPQINILYVVLQIIFSEIYHLQTLRYICNLTKNVDSNFGINTKVCGKEHQNNLEVVFSNSLSVTLKCYSVSRQTIFVDFINWIISAIDFVYQTLT